MTQKPAKPGTQPKRSPAATAAEQTKRATRAKRAVATAAEPTTPATRAKRSAAEPANRAPVSPAAERAKPSAAPPSPSATATSKRSPNHEEISARAYFIALEEDGGDEVTNWLRAERELATA